jgi:hypothetical protein
MNDDFLFKNTCKVLLSLLFILLISRIDKSPLDMPSTTGSVHTSIEVSFIEKSAQTVDSSLFLIRLYFDPFTAPVFKHQTTIPSVRSNLVDSKTASAIFCKYQHQNRSNQVITKVLLI